MFCEVEEGAEEVEVEGVGAGIWNEPVIMSARNEMRGRGEGTYLIAPSATCTSGYTKGFNSLSLPLCVSSDLEHDLART